MRHYREPQIAMAPRLPRCPQRQTRPVHVAGCRPRCHPPRRPGVSPASTTESQPAESGYQTQCDTSTVIHGEIQPQELTGAWWGHIKGTYVDEARIFLDEHLDLLLLVHPRAGTCLLWVQQRVNPRPVPARAVEVGTAAPC